MIQYAFVEDIFSVLRPGFVTSSSTYHDTWCTIRAPTCFWYSLPQSVGPIYVWIHLIIFFVKNYIINTVCTINLLCVPWRTSKPFRTYWTLIVDHCEFNMYIYIRSLTRLCGGVDWSTLLFLCPHVQPLLFHLDCIFSRLLLWLLWRRNAQGWEYQEVGVHITLFAHGYGSE